MLDTLKKMGVRLTGRGSQKWLFDLTEQSTHQALAHAACAFYLNNYNLNGDGYGLNSVVKLHYADGVLTRFDLGKVLGQYLPAFCRDYGDFRVEEGVLQHQAECAWVVIERDFATMTAEALASLTDQAIIRIIREDDDRLAHHHNHATRMVFGNKY